MVIKEVNLETVCGVTSKLPENTLPEVAFAGKSNVGKSSLINALMNRKSLARTSAQPGKTQTINFYNINDAMYLVDLPGYGYAKVPKSEKTRWAEMMEGYFNSDRNIKLVVQLVDMRHPPTADDMQMLSFLQANGYDFAVALTKCDKLKKKEFASRWESVQKELDFVPTSRLIPFSSVSGAGAEELLAVLRAYAE